MPAYKYTLKDGKTTKWYANFYYTDWTGEKKHVCKRGFSTQREAKEYEKNFVDQLEKSSDIHFSGLVENYLEDMRHRLKATTMAGKEYLISTKLLPYFGKQRVRDIDAIMIRKWQNKIMTITDENGEKYSQTYIKTIHNQLSAIFNYAVKHYGIRQNPCRLAGSIGKNHAEEMKIWTQEEFERAISYEKKTSFRLAFNVLFYSGIREGELLALTPADVLPSMQLDISKTYAVVNGQELINTPKTTRSKRRVAIPKFLYDDILQYADKLGGIGQGERIFLFTKSTLNRELKRLAAVSELEPIRVHDLRHSHASMLINMGEDIFEISRRLGHESVKTTSDIYGHLYPDKDIKLASRINDMKRK